MSRSSVRGGKIEREYPDKWIDALTYHFAEKEYDDSDDIVITGDTIEVSDVTDEY